MSEKRSSRKSADRTKRVAVSGMMVALGVIILYVGSLIEVLDITMAAIASLLCILAVVEYGRVYAWMVFLATALSAMLVLPEKFTPSLYALLLGYYPILKELIERIGKKSGRKAYGILRFAIKIVFFNVALLAVAVVAVFVLMLPDSGEWLKVTVFLLANVTFVLYDVLLTRLVAVYFHKLRKRIKLPGGRR